MACRIERSKDNEITKVLDKEGRRSKLFDTISKHPMVNDAEQALNIYANIENRGVNENEVNIVNRVNGEIFESYKDALKNSQENTPIEIGYEVDGKFHTVAKINKNTNKNSRIGYINNLIENDKLSDVKKRMRSGEYRFQSEGETEAFKEINAEIIEQDAPEYLGRTGIERDGTTFKLEKTKGKTFVFNSKGEIVEESSNFLNTATFEEIKTKHGEQVALEAIVGREWAMIVRGQKNEKLETPNLRTEKDLKLLLMKMLSNLGISTLSITEYNKKYASKKGVDPSAKALADIANQVIALQDGEISVEDLTEETVHFLIEALPQEQIENILRNIHRTSEYAEFAAMYNEIYSKEYNTPEEVDEAVRREVLGKIVAKDLVGRFQAKTDTEVSIISNIRSFLQELINKVRGLFRSDYLNQIQEITDQVEELLYREEYADILNTENFKDSKFRLYSIEVGKETDPKAAAIQKIRNASLATIKSIQNQIHYAQRAAGKSTSHEKATLDRLEERLEKEFTVEGITGIVKLASDYVRRINAAVKNIQNEPLTSEQNAVFYTLKETIVPALTDIQNALKHVDIDKNVKKSIERSIEEISNNVRLLESEMSTVTDQTVRRIARTVQQRHNFPEEYIEKIEEWIKVAQKDSTFFHLNFGQIMHSQDPVLGLMGVVIKDMATERNASMIYSTTRFLQDLREIGVEPTEISQFIDGDTGYIISEVDRAQYYKDVDNIFAETIKQVDPKYASMSNEDILKDKWGIRKSFTNEQNIEFERLYKEAIRPLSEQRMNDEYYSEFNNKFEQRNIAPISRQAILSYYASLSDLHRKATKDGIRDLRNLSEYDKVEYRDLTSGHKANQSFFDNGRLKRGFEFIKVEQQEIEQSKADFDRLNKIATENPTPENLAEMNAALETYILNKNGVTINTTNLSQEAQIALDINKFNEGFEGTNNPQVKPLFYDMLKEAFSESVEDGLEFLSLNSYIGFSDSFWDSMTYSESLIGKLESKKNDENRNKIDSIIKTLDTKGRALKSILRQYKSKNNPAEIDAELMDNYVREQVKEIQADVTQAYREARSLMTEEELERDEDVITTNLANESYNKIIRDLGLEVNTQLDTLGEALEKLRQQAEFAIDHMTEENANTLRTAMFFVNEYVKGRGEGLSNNTVNAALKGEDLQMLRSVEILNDTVQSMINMRLLPYYKRFAPVSYEVFMETMSSENITPEEKVNAIRNQNFEFIEVRPNVTFNDSTDTKQMNPNFDNNHYGGAVQPKLSIYRSSKFTDLFGTITGKVDGDIMSGTSSKNQKLYEAYKRTLQWNREGLDAAGVSTGYDAYLAPQIRKNDIQRLVDNTKNIKAVNIKEAIEQTIRFTPDELIQGETDYGSIKVIPTHYTKKMENSQDVSTDLFWSIAMRNYEGFNKQARMKYYGDMMAISDSVTKRATANGKDVKASNTYKMMENFKNYSLFGVKETWNYSWNTPFGKIDWAQVVRKLISYVKWRNLGLNFVIPITSYLTGKSQLLVESIVQEHIDRTSLKEGRRISKELLPEMLKDFNTIGKKSKGVVLMQYFRTNDLMESFKNSSYSGVYRFLPKLSMGLHALTSAPLYSEITFGMMDYYRVVDGSIMNKRDFENMHRNESKKEIERMWGTYKENSMYSFFDVKDGVVEIDKERLSNLLTDENGQRFSEEALDEYVEQKIKGMGDRMREVVMNTDTMIPDETRLAVQRNAIFSILLTHKQFLPLNISRRTRAGFYNPMTGQYEEGTYVSTLSFVGEAIKEMQKVGSINIIKGFKKAWTEAGNTEEGRVKKMNLKRTAVDLGLITFIGIIGYLLSRGADDDKDNYLLQTTAFFWQRLLNETSSIQKYGTIQTLNQTLESPIVGLNIIQGFVDTPDLFSSELVDRGFYQGSTRRYRHLSKMLPLLSQYNYFKDAESVYKYRQMYKAFNSRSINSSPFMQIATMVEED